MRWRLLSKWRRYRSDGRGAAAVEFALVVTLFIIPLLNVVDAAFYVYDRMALDNAAQAGAQAALVACANSGNLPATGANGQCPQLAAAVQAAVQAGWLGNQIAPPPVYVFTPAKGAAAVPYGTTPAITEYFYCVQSGSNTLVSVGSVTTNTKPSSCANNGGSALDAPGDYIQVNLTYTYKPIFPGLSIVSGMSPITHTAYMRLG